MAEKKIEPFEVIRDGDRKIIKLSPEYAEAKSIVEQLQSLGSPDQLANKVQLFKFFHQEAEAQLGYTQLYQAQPGLPRLHKLEVQPTPGWRALAWQAVLATIVGIVIALGLRLERTPHPTPPAEEKRSEAAAAVDSAPPAPEEGKGRAGRNR
jgi:hypothetical protein